MQVQNGAGALCSVWLIVLLFVWDEPQYNYPTLLGPEADDENKPESSRRAPDLAHIKDAMDGAGSSDYISVADENKSAHIEDPKDGAGSETTKAKSSDYSSDKNEPKSPGRTSASAHIEDPKDGTASKMTKAKSLDYNNVTDVNKKHKSSERASASARAKDANDGAGSETTKAKNSNYNSAKIEPNSPGRASASVHIKDPKDGVGSKMTKAKGSDYSSDKNEPIWPPATRRPRLTSRTPSMSRRRPVATAACRHQQHPMPLHR